MKNTRADMMEKSVGDLLAMNGQDEEDDVTPEELAAVISEMTAGNEENAAAAEEQPRLLLSTQSKAALQRGLALAQAAVSLDQHRRFEEALSHYDRAIDALGQGLNDTSMASSSREHLVETMHGYLDRAQALRLSMPADLKFASSDTRTAAIEAMAQAGFGTLPRGVKLRKEAEKVMPGPDAVSTDPATVANAWRTFVLYTEVVDCLLAFMKVKGMNSNVEKAIGQALDVIEAMKRILS